MSVVLHLMPLDEYITESAMLRPASYDTEGYVHCTTEQDTLLAVANDLYRDAQGPYVALEIDTALLSSPVVYEEPSPAPPADVASGVRFPHVYGPIERSAVVGLRHARRALDGRFVDFEVRPERAEQLALLPHPEGGWYRRTWTSDQALDIGSGTRAAATAILYLLPGGHRSAWHTVGSDELWMWHGPGDLELEFGTDGATRLLGRPGNHAHQQVLVPAGTWQRAIARGETLTTCVVCPGFDFADFTMLDW